MALWQASNPDKATRAVDGNNVQTGKHWPLRSLFTGEGNGQVAVAGMPPVAVRIDASKKTQAPDAKKNRLETFMDRLFAGTQWIAGQKKEDALKVTLEMQEKGVGVVIDIVGESVSTVQAVEGIRDEYLGLIALLKENGVRGAKIAVRPSALGFNIPGKGGQYCEEIIRSIAAAAKDARYRIDIDMEDHKYTDGTLGIYRKLQAQWGNMGTVLQAALHRTQGDYRDVLAGLGVKAHIRLVKGIYEEPEDIAYTGYDGMHANFSKLIGIGFEEGADGTHIIVATHHEGHILEALKLLKEHPQKTLEIQMLMGVKPQLEKIMAQAAQKLGFKFTLYVPYGKHPAAYCLRRMVESGAFTRMMVGTLGWMKKIVAVPMMPFIPALGRWAYREITGTELVKGTKHTQADKSELRRCKKELYEYLRENRVCVFPKD